LEITLSIVGTIALLFGAGVGLWRISMLIGWKRRPATVVGYHQQRAHRGSSTKRLTVRMAMDEGDVEARDEGVWNRYREGQTISVLVVPESDPVRVVVPEFLRFWMMSLIFVPFGAAFLYAALVYVPGLG
jgi:hypothetical protein